MKNRFFFVCMAGTAEVESLDDASTKWTQLREQAFAGVSEIGNGGIVVNERGQWICNVAYNGRLFSSQEESAAPYTRFLLAKLAKLQSRQLCVS